MAECLVVPVLNIAMPVALADPAVETGGVATDFTLEEAIFDDLPEQPRSEAAPVIIETADPLQMLIEDMSGITGALREPVPMPGQGAGLSAPALPEAAMPQSAAVETDAATNGSNAATTDSDAATVDPDVSVANSDLSAAKSDISAADSVPFAFAEPKPAVGPLPQPVAANPAAVSGETPPQPVAVDTDALPGRERPRRIVADAETMMAETAPRIVPPGRATNTPETAPQDMTRIAETSVDPAGSDPAMIEFSALLADPAAPAAIIVPLRDEGVMAAELRSARPAIVPVARQIAEAVIVARDDVVEIALAPEELGRLRLVMSGPDHNPHVAIWVERPEVLDQLRRNAAILQECLGDAGMAGATLEFHDDTSSGSRGDRPGDVAPGRRPFDTAEPVQAIPVAWTPMAIPARLDIRI